MREKQSQQALESALTCNIELRDQYKHSEQQAE
jgi:hypothetical protein